MLQRSVPSVSSKVADVPDPEPHPTTPSGSSSSTDSARAQTLDGCVERTQKKSAVSLSGDSLAGSVGLKSQEDSHSGWDFEHVTSDSVDTGIFHRNVG